MKYLFTILMIYLTNVLLSQNVGINGSAAVPDASAMLDVSSSNKGLLIPRVALTSTTDVTTIPSPQTSLMVYNTNASMTGGGVGYYFYDGSAWRGLGNGKQMIFHSSNSYNGFIQTVNSGLSYIFAPPTGVYSTAGETASQLKMPRCIVTRLRITINNNSLNGTSTITLRKNATNTALTVTIPAGSTTTIESNGGISFNDGDLLSVLGVNAGTSGNIGISKIEITYY